MAQQISLIQAYVLTLHGNSRRYYFQNEKESNSLFSTFPKTLYIRRQTYKHSI